MQPVTPPPAKPVTWFWIVTALGLAWNLFGLVQFAGNLGATQDGLKAACMTAEQANVMLGYPSWMTFAFAVGVIGGVIATALMGLRKSLSVKVFTLSMLGYVALWIGDAVYGVFAALGAPQIAILSLVVAISVALLQVARKAMAWGWLDR